MATARKYFGTDGIRGMVGKPPITPDFVMKLGWAAGRILAHHNKGPVIIGKDTRVSGYMFESALEAGLSAAGVDIRLLGPMPTPGIAFLTMNTRAQAGIVISASHNPFSDNGIKFFSADGKKLPDDVELAIEQELEKTLQVIDSGKLGKAMRMNDAPRRYIEFCKTRIQPLLDLSGIKLVVDCANGATYHIAPEVFEELGANVTAINTKPDGFNINLNSGATSPEQLRQLVKSKNADVGIALDGDGDRLIMVDNNGQLVDGDDLLYILANRHVDEINGAVVGTLMSNLALEKAIQSLGLDFIRAKVGDRYIMEILQDKNLLLGGETSGHIIDLRKSPTGDGIISALQVLEVMKHTGRNLAELHAGLSKYPQSMVNVRTETRIDPMNITAVKMAVEQAEQALNGAGRILIRSSGTEPLIRVMVEGEDVDKVSGLAASLANEIKSAVQNVA